MSGQRMKIGLAISIMLNIFLIGGVGGGLVFWRLNPQIAAPPAARAAAAGQRRALRFAADGLAPAQQLAFRKVLRQARLDTLPQLRQAQGDRKTLLGLFSAQEFDRPAIEAALSGARAADMAVRSRVETAIVDYAASLSPEDRGRFAQGLALSPTLRAAPVRQNSQTPATENPPPVR